MTAALLTTGIAIISARNALETLLARRVPPAKRELNHNPVYASPTPLNHLHLQVKVVTQYIEVLQLKVHANCGFIVRLELVEAEAERERDQVKTQATQLLQLTDSLWPSCQRHSHPQR